MDICLLDVRLLLATKPYLQVSGLVVSAVGARHELLELALEWEPCLQVELLGSRVVEGARDNGNDLVRQAERLVESLGDTDHLVEHLPGLLGVSEHKLLDLGELVDTEDTPGIATVCTCLSPVAGGVTTVLQGQVRLQKPLISVEGGDGLLRGGNEVLVVLWWAVRDLVELLVKLGELGRLCHHVLQHELGCLQRSVAPQHQELQAVVDQSLVEEGAPLLEEVTTVSDNLDTTLRLVSVYPGEDLVVRQAVLLLHRHALWCPCTNDRVVRLVHRDRDAVVHDVADGAHLHLQLGLLHRGRLHELLLGLLQRNLLLEKFIGVLLVLQYATSAMYPALHHILPARGLLVFTNLLPHANGLLVLIDLAVQLRRSVEGLAVVVP